MAQEADQASRWQVRQWRFPDDRGQGKEGRGGQPTPRRVHRGAVDRSGPMLQGQDQLFLTNEPTQAPTLSKRPRVQRIRARFQ